MKQSTLLFTLLLSITAQSAELELPAYVLQLPASVKTVLIAETATATLRQYDARQGGLVLRDERPMSIGQNGVGKQKSGDRRTPLGVYFVVEELDTSPLHEKYGPVAFPLDYPNIRDEQQQRTGYGIWVHGVTPGSGPRPAKDTDGCIALPNDELLAMALHMVPLETPVIITRQVNRASKEALAELRSQLLAALTNWADSYRQGDWSEFLRLYATDFEYRGMQRDEWLQYRLLSSVSRPIDDFNVDDVLLIADPEETDLYISRFRQTIIESGQATETIKRLYWRQTTPGVFRIVAEDNG